MTISEFGDSQIIFCGDHKMIFYLVSLIFLYKNLFAHVGTARTPFPATKNNTHELFTLGIIAEVNSAEVQWPSLTPEEPPS